jgi:1-acyl-sn-glycerol-3-phosphate acyltransferase
MVRLVWLNGAFYVLFIVFSAVFHPVMSLFVLAARLLLPRRRYLRRLRRVMSWYGWVIIRVLPWPLIRVRYEDLEPGRGQGCIVVCNHRSSSDAFLMAVLPFECTQVVNLWPFRLPLLGFVARLADYLSIRGLPFEEFVARAIAQLRDGVCVIGFPEGTRSGGRGMGPFHSALFRVALRARAPIVPLCISGNERTPPRGSLLLRPSVVRIRKLRALEWPQYRELTPFQLKNRVHDMMTAELDKMDRAA